MIHPFDSRRLVRLFITLSALTIGTDLAWSSSMLDDPKGFHNLPWGAALSSRSELKPVRSSPHIVEYLRKEQPSSFAGAEMTSIVYVSLDDQFARVVIRYHGDQVHGEVLSHLQGRFGQLDRLPGQMARGLTQQYNWRGPDTEINLTYQASTERGYVFIDSRPLAPPFNDYITDSAE
jgi:hypothetical protein